MYIYILLKENKLFGPTLNEINLRKVLKTRI